MVAGWAASQLHTPSPACRDGCERVDADRARWFVRDREPVAGDSGEKDGREHGQRALRGSTHGSLRALEDERHERQQPDAGEERSADEEQPVTGVAPVQHDPADCEDAVERRSACGHVSERKHGCRERGGHPEARVEPARDRGAQGEGDDELGRPEGKERRAEDGRHDAERYGDDAPRVSLSGSERLFGLLRRPFLARRPAR